MKYDWRLRDINNSTTDTALIGRLVNEYNKYASFLSKSGTPTITLLSAANYSKVIYIHGELGDDINGDGTPDNPYKSFAGGVSNADNPINTNTIVVAIGNFDADLNVNNALVVADTFGCVVINSNATVQSIHVGCYISTTAQLGGAKYCNCIVDCNGITTSNTCNHIVNYGISNGNLRYIENVKWNIKGFKADNYNNTKQNCEKQIKGLKGESSQRPISSI